MSTHLLREVNDAYERYYNVASEAELDEESRWGSFALEQLAFVCCDERWLSPDDK